jgi:hypothetical protein
MIRAVSDKVDKKKRKEKRESSRRGDKWLTTSQGWQTRVASCIVAG